MDKLRRAILITELKLQEARDNNNKTLEEQVNKTLSKLYEADQMVFYILNN